MNNNQVNIEQQGGGGGLQNVANTINESGLPSVAEMRAVVEKNANERFQAEIAEKLKEYGQLFARWTSGEKLTNEETERMVGLSDEFERLQQHLPPT